MARQGASRDARAESGGAKVSSEAVKPGAIVRGALFPEPVQVIVCTALGESLKLAILTTRITQAARRFFGVPDFHYYALADGLRVLLSRFPPQRPQSVASTSTSQLWLFRFT